MIVAFSSSRSASFLRSAFSCIAPLPSSLEGSRAAPIGRCRYLRGPGDRVPVVRRAVGIVGLRHSARHRSWHRPARCLLGFGRHEGCRRSCPAVARQERACRTGSIRACVELGVLLAVSNLVIATTTSLPAFFLGLLALEIAFNLLSARLPGQGVGHGADFCRPMARSDDAVGCGGRAGRAWCCARHAMRDAAFMRAVCDGVGSSADWLARGTQRCESSARPRSVRPSAPCKLL